MDNYEIKNNMYQTLKILFDAHNSISIPAKGTVVVKLDKDNEQMQDLMKSKNITYRKI